MRIDMDRVTAQALAELERTDVGITLLGWMSALIEDRKELLARHRGFTSIPEMWHDQGFVAGVRAVAHVFQHAKALVDTEDSRSEIQVPEPAYLGADPNNPRR